MNSRTLEISDELWGVAEKVIPAAIFKGKGSLGGRPNQDFRQILIGIFYVLTTGCQWRRMPREFGHHSVVYKYFRCWVKTGSFDRTWTEALRIYDQNLCGDKAYDSIWCGESADDYGYRHHFRVRGESVPKKPRYKAKRWVVERTNAWMNRFRRIIIRWDVFSESYEAFISLAYACITLSKL